MRTYSEIDEQDLRVMIRRIQTERRRERNLRRSSAVVLFGLVALGAWGAWALWMGGRG